MRHQGTKFALDVQDYTPHDLATESYVIGYFLVSGLSRFDEAVSHLTDSSFFSSNHRELWRHLVDMRKKGINPDRGTAQNHLALARQDADPEATISELLARLPKTRNIIGWIYTVRSMAERRHIIAACEKARNAAVTGNPEEVAGRLSSDIGAIGAGLSASITNAAEHVEEAFKSFQERINGPVGLSTGIRAIDTITRLKNGAMIVLAARSSIGKTALAMNMATHLAVNEKRKVLFFSLEMKAAELIERAACSDARIALESMSELDYDSLGHYLGMLRDSHLRLYDQKGLTIDKLRAEAKREKLDNGLDIIFIDYIQYIKPALGRKHFNREQEVAEISQGIKAIAAELNVPIVVLAQLNRGAEGSERPSISNIRESGAIEQDADVIMLLHRDRNAQMDGGSTLPAEVLVAKNRSGRTGIAKIAFIPAIIRFEDEEASTWKI